MNNNSENQNNFTDEKRQNRLKMRQKLKLNLDFKNRKAEKQDSITPKTLSSLKDFKKLCNNNFDNFNKKEFIIGNFQDSYELKQKIGQGAHATVYKCVQKSTRKYFAVKITKQGDEQLLESSKHQFQILKEISHKNIMKAESFYIDKNKMTTYLVCELCDFSELAIFIRNQNTKSISEVQATSIISKVLQTLQYLHGKGICHRDIKPENILYDPETKNIKLIDFDCAKIKKQNDSKHQMWTKTGSLHYQAPQYFSQGVYTQKVDIWGLGVIAYQLVIGQLPFKSNYYHRIVQMITQNELDLQNLNISSEYKSLLKKMLEKDQNLRFSAKDCRRLPILLKQKQNNVSGILDDFIINQENSKLNLFQSLSCTYLSLSRKNQQQQLNQSSVVVKYFCLGQI